MRRLGGLGLVAMTLAGCVTTPPLETLPQVQAWLAAGGPTPPSVRECPYVAGVDLWAIATGVDPTGMAMDVPDPAYYQRHLEAVVIPDGYRRPPSDARVVLTAVLPPGGMAMNEVWSVVWQEADGSWWFWRQDRLNTPRPPPPAIPPDASEAAHAENREALAAYHAPDHVRWPPTYGRLAASQATILEAALADPCRAWEPDLWPWNPPLRPARAQPAPPHPFDWTPTHVWLQEMGRPPRMITEPNEHDSHAETIREIAYLPYGG